MNLSINLTQNALKGLTFMIELTGRYNTAKVFTDNVEQEAISQIIMLLNQNFAADSTIRIMPDTHAGAGCTIGTTMTIHGKLSSARRISRHSCNLS